jgi:hypothetical protein
LFVGQVSARFWLMDCRNVAEATKMATNLYKEAIHVPFMSKFVVFSKRHEQLEVDILRGVRSADPLLGIRIRRIHMFLDLQDPDPFARGTL